MRTVLLSVLLFACTSVFAEWAPQSVEAREAWDQDLYGDGIIIALVGTGVDLIHPSLQDAIATNSGEMGLDRFGQDKRFNRTDDDGNGFADDWAGWNFARNSGNAVPRFALGTQLAGIIGGQHRDIDYDVNKLQGIAPGAKILPISFIEDNGSANPENILRAIDYAVMMGARIINASWTLEQDIEGLREKILDLEDQGILFISSAGNDSRNIDSMPKFPASYNFAHQITVGAHGPIDFKVATVTNFGKNSVHLMAPGVDILTTGLGNTMSRLSNSAASTAYISALAAILWQHRPEATPLDIVDAILTGVQYESSYLGLCWTAGRVNVRYALEEIEEIFPRGE